jgi:hypothetical protein
MKPLLAALVLASWAVAQPAWLQPYPGATPQTRTSSALTESTYDVAAKPAAVIAHYQKLFETAGLPFNPSLDGIGTVVRAAAPECDLLLKIREQPTGASVRVSCAAKSPALTAVPAPAPVARPVPITMQERIAQGREHTRQVLEDAEQKGRQRDLGMAKFDQPNYPKPKPPLPPLAWPGWLVRCDGAPLRNQKGVDRFKLNYLVAEFTSPSDPAEVHTFYADLLNANGYPVEFQSGLASQRTGLGWIQGTYYAGEKPGPGLVIRAEITPADGGAHVELRITRRPY